jgi:hypothetical protein
MGGLFFYNPPLKSWINDFGLGAPDSRITYVLAARDTQNMYLSLGNHLNQDPLQN